MRAWVDACHPALQSILQNVRSTVQRACSHYADLRVMSNLKVRLAMPDHPTTSRRELAHPTILHPERSACALECACRADLVPAAPGQDIVDTVAKSQPSLQTVKEDFEANLVRLRVCPAACLSSSYGPSRSAALGAGVENVNRTVTPPHNHRPAQERD